MNLYNLACNHFLYRHRHITTTLNATSSIFRSWWPLCQDISPFLRNQNVKYGVHSISKQPDVLPNILSYFLKTYYTLTLFSPLDIDLPHYIISLLRAACPNYPILFILETQTIFGEWNKTPSPPTTTTQWPLKVV